MDTAAEAIRQAVVDDDVERVVELVSKQPDAELGLALFEAAELCVLRLTIDVTHALDALTRSVALLEQLTGTALERWAPAACDLRRRLLDADAARYLPMNAEEAERPEVWA